MPPALLRKPDLSPLEATVLSAYHSLLGDRQFGFGAVGQIMWTAIDRYAERHGIEGDAFPAFERLIRVLDAEELTRLKPTDGNNNRNDPPPHR